MAKVSRQIGKAWSIVLIILVVLGIIFGVVKFSTNNPTQKTKQATSSEQKTERTYQNIIRKNPGTNEEFKALRDLASLYIKEDNIQSAQKTTDTLTNKFSDHPDIATALLEIGNSYSDAKKDAEALRLYEYNVRTFPNKESAMWSQVGIVYSCIRKGDDIAIDAAIDKLLRVFSWNKRGLSEAILAVAGYCLGFGKSDKSFELHQYNVANFPNEYNAMWSQVRIIIHYIWAKDQRSTRNSLNTLLTKFANWDTLPNGVCDVAADYIEVGEFSKALELYKYVVDTWPQNKDAILPAKVGIIRANIGLGNISDADVQMGIDKLISEFKDHPDLVQAVLEIGASYYTKAHLMDSAGDTKGAKTVYRKATEVLERLIKEFPDSKVIPSTYFTLAICYAENLGEKQKAIDYFQKILNNWPTFEFAEEVQLRLKNLKEIIQKSPQVSPTNIHFGDIKKGTIATRKVYIIKPEDEELVLLKIRSSSGYLSAKFSKSTNKQYGGFEIEVAISPDIPIGKFEGKLTVYTNDKKSPTIEIPVTGNIQGDIELRPDIFFFGAVKQGETPSCKVALFTTGKEPLKIEKIGNPLQFVSITTTPKTEGKEYEFTATLKDNAPIGTIKGNIIIYTNHLDQPKIEIPVYALIRE